MNINESEIYVYQPWEDEYSPLLLVSSTEKKIEIFSLSDMSYTEITVSPSKFEECLQQIYP